VCIEVIANGMSEVAALRKYLRIADSGPRDFLFVAQGHDGINPHGASRGNIAGRSCDKGQDHSYSRKSQGVSSAYSKEQIGHQASQSSRGDESEDYADRGHLHALAQDQPDHIALLCAERNANTNFMRSLTDEIGNHAVNP